jgi:early secretory antigenic target protein ESAT-6
MANAYGTDFEVMAKAAQSVRDTVEQIQLEMRSLQSNLEPVASAWKGEAASAFLQLMERFDGDGQKLTQALTAIGEALGQNTTNYSQVEESNTGSITSLLKGLS